MIGLSRIQNNTRVLECSGREQYCGVKKTTTKQTFSLNAQVLESAVKLHWNSRTAMYGTILGF